MRIFAVTVKQHQVKLAYEVLVEDCGATVDDVFDESTVVIHSELKRTAIRNMLLDYIPDREITVVSVK